MKTEERLEPTAVFIQRVIATVSELKDDLQHDYERTYPSLGEIIRIVLDEEEAKAQELSFFQHLFLPDIVERTSPISADRGEAIRRSHDPMRLRHENSACK